MSYISYAPFSRYSISELQSAGCSALQLREAGCPAAALRAVHFPLHELVAAGYSTVQLLQARPALSRLCLCNTVLQASFPPLQLQEVGVSTALVLAALPAAFYIPHNGYCYRCNASLSCIPLPPPRNHSPGRCRTAGLL